MGYAGVGATTLGCCFIGVGGVEMILDKNVKCKMKNNILKLKITMFV